MARVLFVSQGYTTHDRRFLEALATTSHDVWFLPCAAVRVQYEARPIPPEIHGLAPLNNRQRPPGLIEWMASLVRFRRCVRELKPDLIHAGPVNTGGFLAALCHCHPLLVMSWAWDVLFMADNSRWSRLAARFTLHQADMVLADCQAVRDRVLSLAPLKPEQVIFFPWGIDLAHFQPKVSTLNLRRRLNWGQYPVVISTRSFERLYGTRVFLEAMRRVLQRLPDARVMMLGDGSLRPQVQTFLRRHNLTGRFHLPGQVANPVLPEYFNEADLYVSAAYSDGTSISLLEAMACALPVVVTDVWGNREWVVPRTNGWLFPAGDVEALAAAVIEALEDADSRKEMAQANVALVRERADWKKNFGQLLAAYDRLLT